MLPEGDIPREAELDDFLRPFEAAFSGGEAVDLKAFLPPAGHPLYRPVLRELVRVDLEFNWAGNRPKHLDGYQSDFPDLFRDRESLSAVAFEEYRLRRQAGDDVAPAEYERRFGVDVTSWPKLSAADSGNPPYDRDPYVAAWLAQALTMIHPVGSAFLGFQLVAELGSGAFSRVYLSRQADLADRLVVLKIAPRLLGESRTLARLQHPQIVPIYSIHQTRDYQAVCMPFLGRTTFADILSDLRALPALPDSAQYLMHQIASRARQCTETSGGPPTGAARSAFTASSIALASLTFVDGIFWLGMLLADGLAHAHSHGVVHRDLKPANILLTDAGQPMLLDFNLSEDNDLHRSARAARVGGTLPYMAPEQLVAFLKEEWYGDERSDIYSFGIILYELLTGRHFVERPNETIEDLLHHMIAERRRPPPLRRWNPAVSPGAESIVHHCLEPEPARRYQSARELADDLERYLAHRPLVHTPDPSTRERARKWINRHPRLTAALGAGSIAAALVLALAGAFQLRLRHLVRLQAEQKIEQLRFQAVTAQRNLHDDLKSIEFLLGSRIPGAEVEQRSEWRSLVARALGRHEILESRDWNDGPLVTALTPEQREELRTDMGAFLLLVAGAVARHGPLDFALRLNNLAIACYPENRVPRAVWRQRAALARSEGQAGQAERFTKLAEETPAQSPRDRFLLLLTEFQRRGRLPEDLPLLIDASRQTKDNFAVWMILGNCYAETGMLGEAVDCFDMAAALRPSSHWPSLCRGLASLQMRDYRKARESFDAVIRQKPDLWDVYYDRALASYELGDLVPAVADLTHLLDDQHPSVRAYSLRARIRAKQGDRAGARSDQEAGRRTEPRDERDWTARGLDRQPRDPRGALADYDTALELNPRNLTALEKKANVLAEQLGRTDQAIAALDTLLAFYPNYVPARAGRGVLHARIGHREAAHADAREALKRDTTPFNTYQVAGIYALTSRYNPEDRREALRLLGSALSQGFGLDLIDNDHDLDAIRNQPEFRQLVEAARARRPTAKPSTARPKAGTHGWLSPPTEKRRSPPCAESLGA
jgi:serine/threonine protein kinase/lipoprotein NlpI